MSRELPSHCSLQSLRHMFTHMLAATSMKESLLATGSLGLLPWRAGPLALSPTGFEFLSVASL